MSAATTSTAPFLRAVMRGMPSGHHLALWRQDTRAHEWMTDPASAVAHAEAVDAEGTDVYVAPAFWPTGHRNRKAADVAGLLALSLDLDVNGSPERDGGTKKGAAPSVREAATLAQSIATPTFVVLSGGGVQPWWVFDEPWTFATDEDREDAAAFARAWEQAHREQVQWKIDATADLARVRRIPGTHNFKGDLPALVKVKKPKGARRYAVADLRAMVPAGGLSMPRKAASASLNGHAKVSADRLASLRAVAGVADVLNDPPADESDRDHAIVKEAIRGGHASDAEAAALLRQVRVEHGDAKNKADRDDYIAGTVANGRADLQDEAVRRRLPSAHRRVSMVRAVDVEPEHVEWAWSPYVPLRSVSLVAGAPGLGKSTLQARLAGLLTRGELEGDFNGRPVDVVMASAEDSTAATLRPRLMAAGADLQRVHFVEVTDSGLPGVLDLEADIDHLREAVDSTGARVLFLDPLVSFIANADPHKDAQVRRTLAPLAALADEANIAVNGLMHLNKREGHDALNRVSGSVAFVALARSILLMGRDADDESAVHLVHVKSNLGKHGPSWRCRVEEAEVRHGRESFTTSHLVVEDRSDARADDLLAAPPSPDERGAQAEAVEYLRATLAEGARSHREVVDGARDLGVSETTLKRAKGAAGVASRQVKGKPHGGWEWYRVDLEGADR